MPPVEGDILSLALREENPMAKAEQTPKEIVQRWIHDGYNAGNIDVLRESVTEDVVMYGQPGVEGPLQGREEYLEWATEISKALPDQQIEIHEVVSEGDFVAARVTLTATQDGPLGDIPPTGESFEVDALALIRTDDGRIAEKWFRVDELGMMQQLGVIEQPGG